MTTPNFTLYCDGWTLDHAYRLDEATQKAKRFASLFGKVVFIYDRTTGQQFVIEGLSK